MKRSAAQPFASGRLPARHFHLLFSLVMTGLMVPVMTFLVTALNVGFVPDFMPRWGKAFVAAYAVAFPFVYFLSPRIRMLMARWVELP